MRVKDLRVKNFRTFADLDLQNLPPLMILVGRNGAGKSSFLDIFAFVKDVITSFAAAFSNRGSVEAFRNYNPLNEMFFSFTFVEVPACTGELTYNLTIGAGDKGPMVSAESVTIQQGQTQHTIFTRDDQKWITPEGETKILPADFWDPRSVIQAAEDVKHPLVREIVKFFENFQVAEPLPKQIPGPKKYHALDKASKKLSPSADNLAVVLEDLKARNPEVFTEITQRLPRMSSGLGEISTTVTDGMVRLKAKNQAGTTIPATNLSAGTLAILAYLVLFSQADQHPVIALEDFGQQIYKNQLLELTELARKYAESGGQIFITTHSFFVVAAAQLAEVFWVSNDAGDDSRIISAADTQVVQNLVKEGEPLGWIWQSGLFLGAD